MAGNSYAGTVYGKDGSILYNTGAGLWGGSMTISDVLGLSWNSSGEVTELSKTAGGTALNPSTTLDDLNMATIELYDVTLGPGCHREDDYSAMQGPAPSGYHVPTKDERVALCGILTTTLGLSESATTMGTYLKMPTAGGRLYSNASVYGVGSLGIYWSSTPYDASNAYYLYFYTSYVYPQNNAYRSFGFSVRCFKDNPVIPTSSWTTLYDGSSIASGAGIFYNATDGLISVSGDGTTWITIADKNLGATTVYNSGDTLSEANCGKYFQWGNNYGFPWTGSVTTSSTQVDASTYGPGNYYSSSTFITYDGRRDTTDNANLWGGETGVTKKEVCPTCTLHGHIGTWHMEWVPGEDDYSAMRGPCDEGFHVPQSNEMSDLVSTLTTLGLSNNATTIGTYLKMPKCSVLSYDSDFEVYLSTYDCSYWTSSYYTGSEAPYNPAYWADTLYINYSGNLVMSYGLRSYGYPVRPFKDVPVEPILPEAVAGPMSSGTIAPSSQGTTLSLWTATENCTCIVSGSLWSGGSGGVTYADLYKNGTRVDSKNSGFISGSVSFEMQVEVSSGDVLTLQTSRGSSSSGAVNNVYVSISNGWSTLYDGSSTATGAGIFWDSTNGIISISGDGTNWITISDKNAGATTVYNQGDTQSDANCGKLYQWGNNYGFAHNTSMTIYNSKVDASAYGPENPYSSSTFIEMSDAGWDSSNNNNLRGGETGVVVLPGHYKRRTY